MSYDCIVFGVGGVGSSVLYHFARRGLRVLGIDRFEPGHDQGSSHGESRLIRLVYLEHPDYVPLLRRAYHLWHELGERIGHSLYHEIGLLYVGAGESGTIPALLDCARQHNLELETLAPHEVRKRYPGFHVPDEMKSIFERGAGYLEVERAIRSQSEEAKRLGATLHTGESVLSWSADGSGVAVTTDKDRYLAQSLVIVPGVWARQLLPELGVEFEVRRKETFWFETEDPAYTEAGGCPAFLFETRATLFYGVPAIAGSGLKVAEHSGGAPVADPSQLDRRPHQEDRRRVDVFLSQFLPRMTRKLVRHSVCMYNMTRDENFVVGRHPVHEQVFFATGFSGHGFKFSPVLGEALAGWVCDGSPGIDLDFLRHDRSGLHSI